MTRAVLSPAPRLGFLGVGWIGRHRMDALVAGGARVGAVADPLEEARRAVAEAHGDAVVGADPALLLDAELDGIVIASPSALHAEQAIRALENGIPVFCQKPLGRTAAETQRVVDTARRVDRLLGVDMSYRHTAALRALRDGVRAGELGDVYAAELVFHNAYGPDKGWFHDRERSGGGCVMDLGIHLVDAAIWLLGGDVEAVDAALYSGGRRLAPGDDDVEDYGEARLSLSGGRTARLACSWNLNAGRDAVIEIRLHGTRRGGAVLNVDGSFYDFRTEIYDGTRTQVVVDPPDDWGGRAAVEWARRLASDPSYDAAVEELVDVARTIDRIYER